MKIKKYLMKDKKLCLKKPRSLGACNSQFSDTRGGDFMGSVKCIFRGRDLIFDVELHNSIYFTDINYFF